MLPPHNAYLGPAAGVAASLLWTFTALFFTAAGKRIGTVALNAMRIGLAVVWLGLTHLWLSGDWLPPATGRQVWLLALSGLVGLTVGDLALFSAFVSIGPRLAMLVMTTAPIFAALFGWAALDETMSGLAWLGMGLTVGGVAWVVLERPAGDVAAAPSRHATGLVLAFAAAVCQAAGSLLSKQGIGHGWLPENQWLQPLAATLIRMFFAGVFTIPIIAWLAARRRPRSDGRRSGEDRHRRRVGYLMVFCGSLVGPFLGVWMSLEAFHRAPLGVAQTLCSLTPVFILPFVIFIQKERVTARAALGALAAVAGTALLFVPPR